MKSSFLSVFALVLAACLLVAPQTVSAQISESTEDWPAWQKVAAGALGATSLMSTIAMIGAAADDDPDDDDGALTHTGDTVSDSGGGSDSGDSESSDGESSDSGDSNSDSGQTSGDSNSDSGQTSGDSNSDSGNSSANPNARKGQGYVEELKDELLMLINAGDFMADVGALAPDYPVLSSYYRELIAEHPEVIAATNETIEGATLVERLNRVMVVHLFGAR